jgi:hypothetical protein
MGQIFGIPNPHPDFIPFVNRMYLYIVEYPHFPPNLLQFLVRPLTVYGSLLIYMVKAGVLISKNSEIYFVVQSIFKTI